MADDKAVLQCGIYIRGFELTPEEQEREDAKFKALYDSFQERHGEKLARITAELQTWD